jgi:hypothetical protein
MTRKAENNASSQPSEVPSFLVRAKPKVIVLIGRGHGGKTFTARWVIDRAHVQGREIVVADVDPTNPALAAYFDGVLSPPSGDLDDMEDWAVQVLERLTIERYNGIIDFGAGSPLLKLLARRIDFADHAKNFDVEFVAIYLLTPDLDDLAMLRDLETDGLFAPEATILALNEGVVPGHKSFEKAFKPVLEHPIFKAAVQRGAKMVAIPKLAPASEITVQRLTMSAAERGESKEGRPPLGPINRQSITKWLRDMEQNFAHVAHWLP